LEIIFSIFSKTFGANRYFIEVHTWDLINLQRQNHLIFIEIPKNFIEDSKNERVGSKNFAALLKFPHIIHRYIAPNLFSFLMHSFAS
jgi:hypothetical protein